MFLLDIVRDLKITDKSFKSIIVLTSNTSYHLKFLCNIHFFILEISNRKK